MSSSSSSCSVRLLDSTLALSQFDLPTPAQDTLIVFDFDLTLSHLPIITTTRGTKARSIRAELRGGADTLAHLRRWHDAGARFLILTAKVDSVQGVLSVIQRLKQLGIDAFFRTAVDESASPRLEAASKAARIRTAAVGDIIGSGHNKPEAFWMFAQSDPSIATRRHLVYVEDCADHILNFEHAFRRVFSSRNDNDNNTNNNANERSTIDDIAATASTTTTTTTVAAAAGGVESEPDVLSSVDSRQFAFEDATLLFWPPALEDGFETLERHSADAHERLIARCGAESAQLKT